MRRSGPFAGLRRKNKWLDVASTVAVALPLFSSFSFLLSVSGLAEDGDYRWFIENAAMPRWQADASLLLIAAISRVMSVPVARHLVALAETARKSRLLSGQLPPEAARRAAQ